MRLLHLTDTHLGVDRTYRGAEAGWRRADDHHLALARALEPARRGEVDAVIHTGDLFDRSRPRPEAVAQARARLGEVARAVPVVVTHGNHDWRGLGVHLGDLPGVTVVDRPATVDLRGLRVAVLPWIADAEAWAAAARALGDADLWAAHQAFAGSRVPGFTFRPGRPADTVGPEHLPPGARWVLAGHVHPRQRFRVGAATVVHPGTPERTSFTEHAEPTGYALWEVGATVRVRLVDLPARRMVVVRAPAEAEAVAPGDLVRLDGAARTPETEARARARGGWVAPWSADRQVALFPGR